MGPKKKKLFESLSNTFNTPYKVQKLLYSLRYNLEENGDTVRSAKKAWENREAHCLEAAFIAAAILEHQGYPPLVLSLESKDNLDHVLYVFKEPTGWGALSRSKEVGLHGRSPHFSSIEKLALSYAEPFVDLTGMLTAYGLAHLDEVHKHWRDSETNIWSAENYLIDLKHTKLKYPKKVYQDALKRFKKTAQPCLPKPYWW